jgi:hypothetical protein
MEENDMWQSVIQTEVNQMKVDIRHLQDKSLIHESAISELKSDLSDIKDDTKWLRRAITNAFIVGTIGGIIGIVFTYLQTQ